MCQLARGVVGTSEVGSLFPIKMRCDLTSPWWRGVRASKGQGFAVSTKFSGRPASKFHQQEPLRYAAEHFSGRINGFPEKRTKVQHQQNISMKRQEAKGSVIVI
jgi:hypothetical protein